MWSDWSNWGDCVINSKRCQHTRTRKCLNSGLIVTGNHCIGSNHEQMDCNRKDFKGIQCFLTWMKPSYQKYIIEYNTFNCCIKLDRCSKFL